ncbi:hypothetical protein Desor_3685 [Desulfosporosinus orientis DSM 765]|uniref:DUF3786 domain-containing protein n=1 Tax=Desulfosporosinus orientis (strain ATCC 19365 / DSM 765 / NCIMB 8382 / VKM B-1628 / Singapore I) TaxID=768706 RepID=G7WIS9_DESOD|nr:DUF3786 domain-containing protein [Desulfosporosinus orientis]AET69153.1 hypothetical protein Desor_3685 [Desulfosporosinus orientis DSM 765]
MSHGEMESESNYQVVYSKLWQDIKKRSPKEITAVRSVSYNSDTRQFIVMFFNEEYIVNWDNEIIFRKTDGFFPDVMATIIMLNYLACAQPLPESDPKWVSVKEIPGGMIFYSAFHKRAILVLTEIFGHQAYKLLHAAQSLGGETAPFGDSSVVFKAFPEVPLCVIVWEGDEEVRANATVLYDPSIRSLLPSGIIIDLGIYLAGELKRLAEASCN